MDEGEEDKEVRKMRKGGIRGKRKGEQKKKKRGR